MKDDKPPYFNIATLARKNRLTRRTIRYYIQRGLLPRPEGGGRGHYYTDEHQRRLDLIQRWSRQGVPLEKIKEHLSEEQLPDLPKIPEPENQLKLKADNISLTEKPPIEPKHLLEELYASPSKTEAESPAIPQVPVVTKFTHWTRVHIRPDMELSFRPGTLSREDQEAIEQFISSRLRIK
jgi:DNA-binding transcriptional MerR regulator